MKLRYIYFTTITVCILLISGSNFSYAAEECQSCTRTSPYIDTYINFVNEILSAFQTFAYKEDSVLQQKWEQLITNWSNQSNANSTYVDSDTKRILQSIVDNLNQKTQMAASSTFVFSLITLEWALLDSWKSIAALTNSQWLLRDWQKIDAVWQSITNTLLDLGNNWVFIRLWFRPWREERLEEILSRYSTIENAPISYTSKWTFTWQPPDLLTAIRRMNQSRKTAISVWINDFWNTYINGTLWFSQWVKDNVLPYYQCSRSVWWAFRCSTAWRRAKENLQSTWQEWSRDAKNAKDRIVQAIRRLSGFRSSNDKTRDLFKQRQNELLMSEYGLSAFNWWVDNAFGFKQAWKTLKNDTTTVWPFAGIRETRKTNPKEPFKVQDTYDSVINRNSRDNISESYNRSLAIARANRTESVYTDVSPITKIFPTITTGVTSAKWIIDNTTSNSIIENLWKACDLQCRNLWWKCRYQ
jgi:hypothetical protein